MTTTPVTIEGALVAFDPLILKGDAGSTGLPGAVGAVGATTNLTMGTVTTVPFGQAASASLTGTAPNQHLNLILPQGPTGEGGAGGGLYANIVADFGATTGSTDNVLAIQSAIDTVSAAGGGTVFIPQGTFITSALTLRSNCSLLGESRKGSILQLKAGAGTDLIISDGFSANRGGAGFSAWGTLTPVVPSYFSVGNMTLDGQGVLQPTPGARADWPDNKALLKLWGYHMHLYDLELINARENALYTEHYGQWEDTFNEFQFAESNFERIYAKNYGAVGWVNRGPHDSACRSVILSSYSEGVVTKAQYGYIQQASGSNYSSSGMIAENLHVWGEHSENAVYIDTSNVVAGWIYAEGCTKSAIKIVNSSGNSFEATVGFCADGVEMFSGNNNNIRASVQSDVSGSLFKLRATSGSVLTQLPGGNATTGVFDCTTGAGNYVGGNNVLTSARPFNSTLITGTANTTDRLNLTGDATSAANRVGNYTWPTGSTAVTLSNVAAGAATLALSTAELTSSSGFRFNKRVVASAVTCQTSDWHVMANAASVGFTVTLPTAVGIDGKVFIITKIDSAANNVLVATTSSQTINSTTTKTLKTQWAHLMVQSDGANWVVIADDPMDGLATGYVRVTSSTGDVSVGPVGTTLTVSSNTYTPNCDTTDVALITTPTANFTVVNPTGTPRDGQGLTLRVKSSATGYTPTWGTAYGSSGIATLPSGTFATSKTCTLGFTYDAAAAKWMLLALDATGY